MNSLELTVRYPPSWRHPMHRHLDSDPAAERSRMLAWNLGAGGVVRALFHVVADRDPYVDALDDVGTIETYDVAPVDDASFYVFVREATGERLERFTAAFAGANLVVVPPLTYLPRGRLRFEVVGDPDALRSAVEGLPDPLHADVNRLGEYDHAETATAGLTDRQRAALDAALRVGYYDVPRTGGVEAVAAELGCAPSTASNHLRKAEASLVRRARAKERGV